ncbi:glycosyltransferase [Mycobacterium sp.]|uniref:glycosyltransferase n=1 Tax=Mycobacterium sp. TaxID=1785 RepID=UPI002B786FD4|nr:glycosyltransferase [Mycobacterium sp.]HKP43758.1 glycosyltransferase [Mycobacterium sp.]
MTRHILILVENLSVPFDRRVWQEAQALTDAGFKVTVICPTGANQDREREALIEGVRILRYPLFQATGGPIGYVLEYTLALFHTLRLAIRVRRSGPIDIVHACNPPDLLFLIALALRPGGTRFVFDHHDLGPEMYLSRFPDGGRILYWLTRFVERLTFAAADAVISTNESYRRVAIERGKFAADRVVVVRSAPDLSRFIRREPDTSLRRGKPYLLAYLGVMGPSDGVDYAVRALQLLRDEIGRDDVHCIFMGAGDTYDELVALSEQLGLADFVEFPGRVTDEFVQRCLSTADVCLAPDPLNPLNNLSTMNKVVEYMAMRRPIVSFDLVEARVSAGDAAVYVQPNDELAFAKAIDALLQDPGQRRQMGESGYRRVAQELSWEVSRRALVRFYEQLLGRDTPRIHDKETTMTEAISSETHAGAQYFCRTVRSAGGLGPEPRLLVAGCGKGHEALFIRRELGGSVVGVDISEQWDPWLDAGVTDFRLLAGSILELPFADGSFDAVFYHHVIEHVDKPAGSLRELARVLRPGGLIFVGTPNRHRAVGYLGSFDATTMEKLRWNLSDYRARVTNRFRNELGAHAGFSEKELHGLLAAEFTDIRFITDDYLRFKYGDRLPELLLRAARSRGIRDVASPSVYAIARRPVEQASRTPVAAYSPSPQSV